MRATALPILALPLLLTYCGAKQDLLIGEIALVTEAGTGSVPSGGTGEPATAGSTAAGVGGTGAISAGGSAEAGAAGEVAVAGAAGQLPVDDCVPGEEPPLDSLLNRYSFDGGSTIVTDSIAGQNGTVLGGAVLDGTGKLSLAGGSTRQYVNLPNGLVSPLTDVTIVAWITWSYGAGYQRVFDFGISDAGEVQGGSGRSYIAVMPSTGFENGQAQGLGAEIKAPTFDTVQLASTVDMDDRPSQVGFVFRSAVSASLYVDATLLASSPTAIALSDIDDRNNWLGQSQWMKDHNYGGLYDEVRIYGAALNSCQLRTLFERGPEMP